MFFSCLADIMGPTQAWAWAWHSVRQSRHLNTPPQRVDPGLQLQAAIDLYWRAPCQSGHNYQVQDGVEPLQLAVQDDAVVLFNIQVLHDLQKGCLCQAVKVHRGYLPRLFGRRVQDLLQDCQTYQKGEKQRRSVGGLLAASTCSSGFQYFIRYFLNNLSVSFFV